MAEFTVGGMTGSEAMADAVNCHVGDFPYYYGQYDFQPWSIPNWYPYPAAWVTYSQPIVKADNFKKAFHIVEKLVEGGDTVINGTESAKSYLELVKKVEKLLDESQDI